MLDLQPIPTWLEIPAAGAVRPPTRSLHQDLPFGELRWEDFERLCLRLARLEGDVEHCQLYGVPGENQEGIDIFARIMSSSKYRVYQCKRENEFGPAKIKAAVERFLHGKWIDRTDVLCLCTKECLRSTHRATELESQNAILKGIGISLIPWDSHQLSILLKDQPRIVDD